MRDPHRAAPRRFLALLLSGALVFPLGCPVDTKVCGDGRTSGAESCDDGNTSAGDGCSPACQIEVMCADAARGCAVCGDGRVEGREGCDDGNLIGSDGCSSECVVRAGWLCAPGSPSVCSPVCGDGVLMGAELCDDGNDRALDGCAGCVPEEGWRCEASGCAPICGDGLIRGDERCDDGNQAAGDGCTPSCLFSDRWRPLGGAPTTPARAGASAVWTGQEVLMFGGRDRETVAGGIAFEPTSGTFRAFGTEGAPETRERYAVAWTGTEMLVFGGLSPYHEALGDGAAYDPRQRRWRRISSDGAPSARWGAGAAWTGRELFIFGGESYSDYPLSGGLYNPALDRWRPVSELGAPAVLAGTSVTWSGSEVLDFGGAGSYASSGRYDPELDEWRPMSLDGAPSPRMNYLAIWASSELIVWGGVDANGERKRDGARYDPTHDRWTPMSPAPGTVGQERASVVWTGDEVIIWGGTEGEVGVSYAPALDRWTLLPEAGQPSPRWDAASAFTGTRWIVLGGAPVGQEGPALADGAFFDVRRQSWTPIDLPPAPVARAQHTAVWTDREMIIFGGEQNYDAAPLGSGGRFNPDSGRWTPLPLEDAPEARVGHTTVWTGAEMVVFGGDTLQSNKGYQRKTLKTGATFRPDLDRWTPLPTENAPRARTRHSAVWTGSEMIVWGGLAIEGTGREGVIFLDDGARFDPLRREWHPITHEGAPSARALHAAFWIGDRMLVWGGARREDPTMDGSIYDPQQDRWMPFEGPEGLSPRYSPSVVWTGRELVVFGGSYELEGSEVLADGARFDPAEGAWSAVTMVGAPRPRAYHSAVWSGVRMFVFGGFDENDTPVRDGARYDPTTDTWAPMGIEGAPGGRVGHSALWTRFGMIIWGGFDGAYLGDGGIYEP